MLTPLQTVYLWNAETRQYEIPATFLGDVGLLRKRVRLADGTEVVRSHEFVSEYLRGQPPPK